MHEYIQQYLSPLIIRPVTISSIGKPVQERGEKSGIHHITEPHGRPSVHN